MRQLPSIDEMSRDTIPDGSPPTLAMYASILASRPTLSVIPASIVSMIGDVAMYSSIASLTVELPAVARHIVDQSPVSPLAFRPRTQ
jgi:hypothetical protein